MLRLNDTIDACTYATRVFVILTEPKAILATFERATNYAMIERMNELDRMIPCFLVDWNEKHPIVHRAYTVYCLCQDVQSIV